MSAPTASLDAVRPGLRVRAHQAFPPLAIFAVTRLFFFLLNFSALIVLPLGTQPEVLRVLPEQLVLDGWFRWDAIAQLTLAREGYWLEPRSGVGSPSVLPVYPALISLFSRALGSSPHTALLLSNLSLAIAMVVVHNHLRARLGLRGANSATLLLSFFPYSFLLSAACPHAAALLFIALALVALAKSRLVVAGVCGGFAALTHPAGLAILPALLAHTGAPVRNRVMATLVAAFPLAIFATYLHLSGFPAAAVVATMLGGAFPCLGDLLRPGGLSLIEPGRGSAMLAISTGLWLLALFLSLRARAPLGGAATVYGVSLCLLAAIVDPTQVGQWLVFALPAFAMGGNALRQPTAEMLVLSGFGLLASLLITAYANGYPYGAAAEREWDPFAPTRLLAGYNHRGEMPSQPLGLRVEDDFLVLGVDLPASELLPGTEVAIALQTHDLAPTTRRYLLAAHISDMSGKRWAAAQAMLPEQDRLPPPESLQRRKRVELVLPIDASVPSGYYRLELSLLIVPPWSTQYQRPRILGLDGSAQEALLTREVVVARPGDIVTVAEARPSRLTAARLADEIALLGYDISAAEPGSELTLTLFWSALRVPERDYTVFVQLLDGEGRVVGQSDIYPMNGGFPTSKMVPGLAIKDRHTLSLAGSVKPGSYQLIAGMYRLDNLARLPVAIDGTETGDFVPLGTLRVGP